MQWEIIPRILPYLITSTLKAPLPPPMMIVRMKLVRSMTRLEGQCCGMEWMLGRRMSGSLRLFKIIAFAAAIIVIPAELILRDVLMDAEQGFISRFQRALHHSFWATLAKIIIYTGEVKFIEGWAVYLYLSSDSLLGFKTSMVTFTGVLLIALLKLLYQIPRPFWISTEVQGKACNFDFSGPSDHVFLATFFYSYVVLIYSKYTDRFANKLQIGLLLMNILVVILNALALNYLGSTFLFQSLIGAICGVLYCIFCITFDADIHSACERIAFLTKTSRYMKFKVFFIALGVFVLTFMYFNSVLVTFKVDHLWIQNSIDDCNKNINYEARMGIDPTFEDTSIIFGIIGATFGASTANITIGNIVWSHTVWWKRLLRSLIGFVFIVGIHLLPLLIAYHDFTTKYFFNALVPTLAASYIAFGVIPILCNYLKLTNQYHERSQSVLSVASFRQVIQNESGSSSSKPSSEESKRMQDSIINPKHEEKKLPFKRSVTSNNADGDKSDNIPLLSKE
ncbi:unnamed protein product [Moneuplotes crassus]|uniref:Phosphatidic acid phosphatase type 2/haloperoxidase domain-containing protein n=1 Tax=Euplotes crassus TaxID=5936 RepID=A0AAD1UFX4_EUPCR|nr:unnamed protein product [Moneuplotes crassus]